MKMITRKLAGTAYASPMFLLQNNYSFLLGFVVGLLFLPNNGHVVVYGFQPMMKKKTGGHPLRLDQHFGRTAETSPSSTIALFMAQQPPPGDEQQGGGGIFGQFKRGISSFFEEDRENDFVKLDQYADTYGPGPLLVLYNVPLGVTNEEIYDMMEDGAPQAFAKGITIYRTQEEEEQVGNQKTSDPVLNESMKEALEGMMNGSFSSPPATSNDDDQFISFTPGASPPIVVTFFSGFSNQEMLTSYNILGSEIYQESQISPACAKAVPNAMDKPLRQVLEEIGGDHRDAMAALEQQQPQQ